MSSRSDGYVPPAFYIYHPVLELKNPKRIPCSGVTAPSLNLLYCIVLYCIVLYCIVLYCIVLYCIVLHCIGDKDHVYALLINQMILPFHFSSFMFVQKSFKFSITVIRLSYDKCSAFKINDILPLWATFYMLR